VCVNVDHLVCTCAVRNVSRKPRRSSRPLLSVKTSFRGTTTTVMFVINHHHQHHKHHHHYHHTFVTHHIQCVWHCNGQRVGLAKLRSRGRGFNFRPFHFHAWAAQPVGMGDNVPHFWDQRGTGEYRGTQK